MPNDLTQKSSILNINHNILAKIAQHLHYSDLVCLQQANKYCANLVTEAIESSTKLSEENQVKRFLTQENNIENYPQFLTKHKKICNTVQKMQAFPIYSNVYWDCFLQAARQNLEQAFYIALPVVDLRLKREIEKCASNDITMASKTLLNIMVEGNNNAILTAFFSKALEHLVEDNARENFLIQFLKCAITNDADQALKVVIDQRDSFNEAFIKDQLEDVLKHAISEERLSCIKFLMDREQNPIVINYDVIPPITIRRQQKNQRIASMLANPDSDFTADLDYLYNFVMLCRLYAIDWISFLTLIFGPASTFLLSLGIILLLTLNPPFSFILAIFLLINNQVSFLALAVYSITCFFPLAFTCLGLKALFFKHDNHLRPIKNYIENNNLLVTGPEPNPNSQTIDVLQCAEYCLPAAPKLMQKLGLAKYRNHALLIKLRDEHLNQDQAREWLTKHINDKLTLLKKQIACSKNNRMLNLYEIRKAKIHALNCLLALIKDERKTLLDYLELTQKLRGDWKGGAKIFDSAFKLRGDVKDIFATAALFCLIRDKEREKVIDNFLVQQEPIRPAVLHR